MLKISALRHLSTVLLSEFVVSAQKFKTLWLRHHVPTDMLPKAIKEIARIVEIATDIGLPHQHRDAITTFVTSKNLINPTGGTEPEKQQSEE